MEIENKRRLRYGVQAFVITVAVVFSVVSLHRILDRKHIRWDFSQGKEHSLSDQTKKVLKNLNQEIQVTAFFRRGGELDGIFIRQKVDDVLGEYAAHSSRVHYQMVDPDAQVEKALQYHMTTDGTVVIESGVKKKEIYQSQLFDYNNMTEGSLPHFAGEGLFTNALLSVTQEGQKTVCFLEGHGERKREDSSATGFQSTIEYLTKNNYAVEPLSLIKSPKIPAYCELVFIAGPHQVIREEEEKILVQWFEEKKGKFLIFLDPTSQAPMPKLLQELKITLFPDLILDPERHFVLGPHYPSPVLEDHPITKDLMGTNPIFLTARSLGFPDAEKGYTKLLTTSEAAWGEMDLSGKEPKFDEGKDKKGPLTLGVVIESKGKAVVVGDADFASNGLLLAPGNLDLFLNMVGWLMGDEEQVAIRPQETQFRNLTLTAGRARFIGIFSQFVYPILILVAGGAYWFRRRHR